MSGVKRIRLILYLLISLLAVGACIALAHAYYFTKIAEGKRVILYSDHECQSEDVKNILVRVDSLILTSSLFEEPQKRMKVYLTGSYEVYSFYALNARKGFGAYNSSGIFIAPSSTHADSVWIASGLYKRRRLSGVIAHELVHSYLRERLGFISYKFLLPEWKNEGLADYVADESSFPMDKGLAALQNGKEYDSPSFRYFQYRLITAFVLREKRMSLSEFLSDSHPFEYWLEKYMSKQKELPEKP
jgi:hypothetical protein